MRNTNILVKSNSNNILLSDSARCFSTAVGAVSFEQTNHLGADVDADNAIDYYKSIVKSASLTYPFGWDIPNRKYSNAPDYRFGFNGKENDKEWNVQDYGFRLYDTRIARFISEDPITAQYPELMPYQFASNNSIANIDLDGLEGVSANARSNYRPPNQNSYNRQATRAARGNNVRDMRGSGGGMLWNTQGGHARPANKPTISGRGTAVTDIRHTPTQPIYAPVPTSSPFNIPEFAPQQVAIAPPIVPKPTGALDVAVSNLSINDLNSLANSLAIKGNKEDPWITVYTATDEPVNLERIGTAQNNHGDGWGGVFVTTNNLTEPQTLSNHIRDNIPKKFTKDRIEDYYPRYVTKIRALKSLLLEDPTESAQAKKNRPNNYWIPPKSPGAVITETYEVTEEKDFLPVIKKN